MSKRRELRQLLLACRETIKETALTCDHPAGKCSCTQHSLLAQIDKAMLQLQGNERKHEMIILPPRRGEPPAAMVQLKLFPFTDEICYNQLMFQDGASLWRYLMEQANNRPGFQQTIRSGSGAGADYQPPEEIRRYLLEKGVRKIPSKSFASKLTLEDLGL